MRFEWMKVSESEEPMRELRRRVERDGVSESSEW